MITKRTSALIFAILAVALIGQAYVPALAQYRNIPKIVMPVPGPPAQGESSFTTNGVTLDPPEYRASWVFSWGSEFASPAATTTMINTLADNNFNVVVPEIRKQGDAYYNSAYEPWASDIVGGYDPLLDMLTKAHARGMEVYGWIVTYRIWPRNRAVPPTHIWAKHPEWAMTTNTGSINDGSYYDLDPGVPGAQQYICDLMKDCLSKYDLDGYNFDYVRYPGYTWGYNPISKERFKAEYGAYPPNYRITDPLDPNYELWQDWCDWRRQQVTDLVKKCYLEAIYIKPQIKMTVDSIGWMGGDPTEDFTRTRAYTDVFQDHRGWMMDRIIDLNILMNYKRDWTGLLAPTYRYKGYAFGNQQADHRLWSDYLAMVQGLSGRHSADGIGGYMNLMQGILDQWGYSRSSYTFDPTTRTYSNLNSDLLTEDYTAILQPRTAGAHVPASASTPTQAAAVATSGGLHPATTPEHGGYVPADAAPGGGDFTDPVSGSSNTATVGEVGSGLTGDSRSTGALGRTKLTNAGNSRYAAGIGANLAAAQRAEKADMIARNPQAANKLWGELLELMDRDLRLGRANALTYGGARGLEISGDRVVVIAVPAAGFSSGQLAGAVKSAGAEVIRIGDDYVKANVPLGVLKQLGTGITELGYARPPAKPRLFNTTISQGINSGTVTNIKNWHDSGLTGDGVKVAIIDAGFTGLAALKAADEIPASAIEIDYSGTGIEATTEHGCAVAETVYDVAPNAQLYLIKISDETDLREAEIYCKANGVKVINHSIGWDGFNFFDGVAYVSMVPSPVSQVNDANGNGILWVNSAGNDRQAHALIQWRDVNGDNALDWNPSYGNINQIGNLSAGTPVVISLTWNAWPTTNQDFDLLLVRWTGSTWEVVAGSVGYQTGTQPPTELLWYVVPSSQTGYHGLAVVKYAATTSPTFIVRSWYEGLEYYGYDNPYTNDNPAPGSITCPADAASAFAVGAIDWNNYRTGPLEWFSSIGPNNRAYTGGTALTKPDICGPDATSTVTYGDYPTGFTGTSASSPHLAGAAALVWSRFPEYTNAQVRSYLETGGINPDLGNYGKDNLYGYGPSVLTYLWLITGYVRDGGGAAISGVLVSANNSGGSYTTAGDGYYTLTVPNAWSGRITPSKAGYSFTPEYQSYASVVSSQSDQNYTATRDACLISGYVRTADGAPIAFVKMNGLPGNPRTDTAGYYSATVPLGWSGTVTPTNSHGVGLCMYRYGFDVGLEDTANPGLPIFSSGNVVAAGSETMFYNTIKSTMFQNPAPIPEMPWKTNPTTGYLFGQVTAALEPNHPIYQNWLYQAEVTATGPAPKTDAYTETTDATGTYGFIDLPPGDYTITVTATGYTPASGRTGTVTAGRATKVNIALGPVIPPENYKTLAAANDPTQTPDGTVIGITGKAITSPTAALSDCIYVEETDRSSGLKIVPGATSLPVAEGDRADLIGIITTVNGERVLNPGSVLTRTASTPLGALGSNIQDLSRSPKSTALLVKIAGKVTVMSVGWFALSDGSGTIKVKCPGIVPPAKGLAVQVSGMNALDPTERVIRVRKQSDINVLAESVVTAPSGTIGMGLDLFSMPYVPTDSSPGAALTGLNISGRLFRWDNASQTFIAYDPIQPVVFGSLCPYEGYALLATAAGTISFKGIPIPTVDARISLPRKGWSLIANPFNAPVLWELVSVTDGNSTLSLRDASAAGWIGRIAFTWDNQAGNFGYVGTGARGSRFDDSLQPWKAYWVATYQDGLALIIPAGG